MNIKARVYFSVGPRQCGKSEMAIDLYKGSGGTILLLSPDVYQTKNLENKLKQQSPIPSAYSSAKNILPVGSCFFGGRDLPDVLICDDYLQFNLDDRINLFHWIHSIQKSVDIYCYSTPSRIYKSSILTAASMLKSGFKSSKIKAINNPLLEEAYYNFLSNPLVEINRLYRPIDVDTIYNSGLPLERKLTEFLGVYEKQ